jgi:hypothetical protein
MKCLEINLIKEVKRLYNENYKTLMKILKMQKDGNNIHGLEAYCSDVRKYLK